MSRRRSSRTDSLEMLLDTICNTFGGVLFIAILVVMLLQQSGQKTESAQSLSTTVTPDEVDRLSQQLEEMQTEEARLRPVLESQLSVVESFATDEVRELLSRRRELISEESTLREQVVTLEAKNAKDLAQIERQKKENSGVTEANRDGKEKVKDLTARLDEQRKKRTTEARLPMRRAAGVRSEVGLVLQYGRIYLWHRFDRNGTRLGLNTDHFVVIGDESGALITVPNPAAGIPLDGAEPSRRELRQLLSQFNPSYAYLTPIVREDSYAAFPEFRNIALEMGFNYRLMPVDAGEPVMDRGGSGSAVQ